MKKIMLICSAGMSTSLLVKRMQAEAEAGKLDVEIFAVSEAESKNHFDEVSVVLLGPQVRYMLEKMKSVLEPKGVPVAVIQNTAYGMMNGKAVLQQALELLK
ncbi:MAG: PTS sugar transporter subunit IIB [Bacillota bacterium]